MGQIKNIKLHIVTDIKIRHAMDESDVHTSQLQVDPSSLTESLTSLFNKLKHKHADLVNANSEEFHQSKETATQLRQIITECENETSKYDDFSPVQKSALDAISEDIKKLSLDVDEKRHQTKDKMEESARLPNEKTNKTYKENIKARETLVNEKIGNIQKSIKPYEQYMGLRMRVTRNEDENGSHLRFTFTLIDPLDPEREFSFSLKIEDDVYSVFDLCPPVADVNLLVKELNDSGDLRRFFCEVRKALKASCVR